MSHNGKIEDILRQLAKDIITPKFSNIKHTANAALELLQNEEQLAASEAWQVREVCLQPLQLALESRARKLGHTALAGIQAMFKDERFHTSMEASEEDKWLPSQVLNVLVVTPTLAEDLQVEVMKLLLNMTVTASWCTSAKTIIKISQLLLSTYVSHRRGTVGPLAQACLKAVFTLFTGSPYGRGPKDPDIGQWLDLIQKFNTDHNVYMGSYGSCVMVQGAVQAAMVTMINKFVGGLVEKEQAVVDDGNDVLADFKSSSKGAATENLISEVVLILTFLTDRLETVASSSQGKQSLPVLLESVNTILTKVPSAIKFNHEFQELLWRRLCPCLIELLGEPKTEKLTTQKPDIAKVGGTSTSAPHITNTAAKVIYSIAGCLANLVGEIPPLRPVLESLFHKMLMFPLPHNRHDALRVVMELMSEPQKVISLLGPGQHAGGHGGHAGQHGGHSGHHEGHTGHHEGHTGHHEGHTGHHEGHGGQHGGHSGQHGGHQGQHIGQTDRTKHETNFGLIKLLVDSVKQCSHCNEPSIIHSSVRCIDSLLASLDRIRQGEGIPESWLKHNKVPRSQGPSRRSMTLNPDDDGGSDLTSDHYNDSHDSGSKVQEQAKSSSTTEEKKKQASETKPIPQSPSRAQFEAAERDNARLFMKCLRQLVPELMCAVSVWEVDQALQDLASKFCANLQLGHTRAETDSANPGVVLNGDGVYMASIVALKLNMKLIGAGHYANNCHGGVLPVTESDFLNEMFGSGLLLYLPPVWLKEVYHQVSEQSLLPNRTPGSLSQGREVSQLINFISDLEGAGTSEVKGRLLSEFRDEELDGMDDGTDSENGWKAEAGKALASKVLSTCWQDVLDILSVMLNEQGSNPSSSGITRYSLSLLLATDSAREDVRRARSAICTSLNGLQRAAKLCCVLGLQNLCSSAFSQLARTSCVKEDFRALAAAAAASNEGKGSRTGSSSKPKLVRLHAAHVLSMDVVMTTGLEMSSHASDCWKHVLRCCAHISELEHTYFSQGNNQSSLPKVTQGSRGSVGHGGMAAEADGSCDGDLYSSPVIASAPVAPRINVAALIEQSSLESGWDNSLEAGGVLTFAQASKALCGLSQEVDSLFEDAANQLCLEALLGFLVELGDATIAQLQKLSNTAASMSVQGSGSITSARPPTNALHLYRLQQVLVRVVNSSRPLLHLLRVWSVVSPYLVQATGNPDHVISKMAVTSIHEFIVSLVSQREEQPHFHVNEFMCKTFEDMLCLELCDGDVQDQIVCCICELVEACSLQLNSGWRPLFGALRSVKIEYTTNEAVNEARRRHVAAVMDVFDVYLAMDNITVFANATVDCVLCLLKYVHGPATFDSDETDNASDSMSEDDLDCGGDGELEGLCVPALNYLLRVCEILASMWQMPRCPVFKGAHRIQMDTFARLVSTDIPHMDFKLFAEEFSLAKYSPPKTTETSGQTENTSVCKEINQKMADKSLVTKEKEGTVPTAPQEAGKDNSKTLSRSGSQDKKMKETTSVPIAEDQQQNAKNVSESSDNDGTKSQPTSAIDRPQKLDLAVSENEDLGSQQKENLTGDNTVRSENSPKTEENETSEKTDSTLDSQSPKDTKANDNDKLNIVKKDFEDKEDNVSSGKVSENIGTKGEDNSASEKTSEGQAGENSVEETGGRDIEAEIISASHLEDNKAGDVPLPHLKTLDEMDGPSGVLHVWLLLLDGLVTAVNHCPKAFQSHALNTLIDMLKSAAKLPGPEFSIYCVNHLLLPMIQSWLRRGSRCYGYWNTGIVSFKQCCGLVADLVVDFVADFSGQPELTGPVQLTLKQTLDLFIECVAQPVENISRLGCSCIRHILLSAGPNFSEPLWQVGGRAVRRALGVTTYNLRLLMALFHANSENFYGDVGQVKVATRKDCTVVDCLRLRQMAKQVFLLDRQISSMPSVQYDTDQDKSFVFLLYPPGHQDSLNPDHISTRVPFRHVVIGLLSNQLLVQTLGELLLEPKSSGQGSDNADAPCKLPGLLNHMSTRNLNEFLSALEDSYNVARQFDARPGLKFLLQKVAGLDVAANLYKQAAAATLFHVHTLLEVCAHLQDSSMKATKDAITPISEIPETPLAPPTIDEIKLKASTSLAKPWTNGQLFLPLLQNLCEELCQSYIEVINDANKGSILDKIAEQPIFFLTAQNDDIAKFNKLAKAKVNEQASAILESQRSKSMDSNKSESVESESLSGPGGMGMIAVDTPQNMLDSDQESDSDTASKEQTTLADSDNDDDRQLSKRELRADLNSKEETNEIVYTVATDQVIENLMSQYKRHKNQRSMPNFVRAPKFQKSKLKIPRKEVVDEALDKQHKSSILKDSEAHVQAWADTLTAILQMTLNLPDHSFSALLPAIYTFVSQLILYASDPALRDQLAQCFSRLGRMYDFAPYTPTSEGPKQIL